jgi:hypothetical protein
MATRMQQRRGTALQWISTNGGDGPVLNAGEIGFESDTNKFKIGDGINHWVDLDYFTTDSAEAVTAEVEAAISALIGGAPGTLDTLNELAAAINDDPAVFTTIATNLSNHQADTTSIHGIADTSLLVTTTGTQTLTNKTITSPAGLVKADVGLGDVDNTSDVNKPISTATQTALNLKANLDSPTFTGTVTLPANTISQLMMGDDSVGTNELGGLSVTTEKIANEAVTTEKIATGAVTKSMVGLDEVDNTSDADKPISTDTQDALDLKANLSGPTFTGTVVLPSTTSIGDVDAEDLATQEYVTTAIGNSAVDQSALAGDGLEWDVDDEQFKVDVTVARVDSVQEIFDLKAPKADPTFTGTVSGVTKTHVGLSNVDNTSDANKPVSTATQTALDLRAPKSNPVFIGTVTSTNDVVINGNLTVNGTNFAASATSITIEDNMLQLAHENPANTVDLGVVVAYNDGATKHSGIIRDASANRWRFFKDVTTEPTTTIDFTQAAFDDLQVATLIADSATIGNVTEAEMQYLAGVTSDIQDQLDDKLGSATAATTYAPIADPTFTGTVSGVTKAHVGLSNVDNSADLDKPVSDLTQAALELKAPLANPTFTGTVSGIDKSMVGLGNVDNTADASKPISDATQTALNDKANIDGPTLTGIVTLPSSTSIGDVTSTEIGYLEGVTSAIQNQLDDRPTEAQLTKTMVGLANVDNTSDEDKPVSTDTQAALDLKANLDAPTFTGTVSGISKSMVGLGNVDNTSDANKPISTATQTALDAKYDAATATSALAAKAPLESPTFTGTVAGVTKVHVGLGNVDNTADSAKPVSTAQATAIATAKSEAIADATAQVNAVIASAPAALNTLDELAAALGDDANFATTVTTSLAAKAPLASPTFTGTVTVAANGVAFTDGTQTKAGVPSLTTTTTTIAGAYNLSTGGLTLRDQLVQISGAHAVTVPTNATTAFPVGTSISFWQSSGAGGASFAAAAGVTIYATPGAILRALYSSATLTKVTTDAWLLTGDLKA